MLQNAERLDTIPNNNAIDKIQPTEVIQEENQDDDYMTFVSPEFEKELIKVGKGLQDGSCLYSDEVDAKIEELFQKAIDSPAEKVNEILDEAFKIAGCLS